MADEIRSELSDDKDSLASGRISRWETKEFDQQSQISDTSSGTAITNMSRNDSQYQSRIDSRTTQDWTDSNVTSRNESHNQNQNEPQHQGLNESQNQGSNEPKNQGRNNSQDQSRNDSSNQNQSRNESQNQSRNDSQSKTPNDSLNQSQHDSQSKHRSESNKQSLNGPQKRNELQYDSIPQNRNASRNQSRNDSQSQVRNESRNESQNESKNPNRNEIMVQSRNDSLNQSQNDSQNETQSRNDSQYDTRTQSRNVSLNQSRNDSQNQSRYYSDNHDRKNSQDQSRNDSPNQCRNDSQNRSRNDSQNQSNSRFDSRQSLEQDRSENVRDSESAETKTMAENTDRSTFDTQQCDVSHIDGGNQRNEFERSDSKSKVPGNIMKGCVSSCDSVSLVSRRSKSPTKSTESNKHGSQNKQGDVLDSRNSRNTDKSIRENNVTDNATQNLKGDEGHLDSKQQFENRSVKKKSELYDTAKEYDYRRASMPEVKHLANGYRHKGEPEVEHDRGEYAYRIAAEIRRPLLRTRRRKRIYGSDMYTSDGDMRRENGIARAQSDMTQNRLLQRTNSQRKLSDVVSSEVFRVRRRMSMPVQYIASSPEGQYNTETEKETLPHESGVCDIAVGEEHVESNTSNHKENRKQENRSIHSHIDASAVDHEQVNSQNSNRTNKIREENSDNTQNTEKHQSVYDIYLELRKMRQVAAECVGTEVRQTIEQKLDKLQSETTEKEEENNWKRIQQKIIKVRKKLKEQEQKEKDRGCSDDKKQTSVDQTDDDDRVEGTSKEEDDGEQLNTPGMSGSVTERQNTVCNEDVDDREPRTDSGDTHDNNKDIDDPDEDEDSVKSDETLTNTSPCDEKEIEHKNENECEDICKTDSPAPGSASRVVSREEKVTFSLDEEQERDQTSDVDHNRSVSISRATSANSSSGKTTPFESPFDSKYELEAGMLEKVSDWSSSDSETEDTFLSELQSPESKYNTHLDRNDLGEEVISCIIQTSYGIQIPFRSSIVDPVELPCVVNTYEVVLSYFVKLTSSVPCTVTSEDVITIAIPYDKEEMKYYQEPVLRALSEDRQWRDVEFTDKIYNDDDNMCITVLETSLRELLVWAVVARPTIDYLKFDDKQNEAVSSTDNDISISVPPGSRYNPLDMKIELKVIPIISEILDEAKRTANNDMIILFRCSSLVTVDLEEEPSQPISISIPCNKPYTRPQTGSRSSSRRSARKSATLRLGTADSGYRSVSRLSSGKLSLTGANEKREETENHLVRFGDGLPLKHKMIKPKEIDKQGKIVCTVLEKSCTCLIIEGRKYSKAPDLEKIVGSITDVLKYQKVHMCVIQSKLNVRLIKISCTLKSHVDCLHFHSLEKGHNLTHGGFRLTEGDVIRLSFRGNITPLKDSDKVFKFYGIHGFQTDWTIGVVDIYSQRSLQCFCGFVQISKWNGDTDKFSLNDWKKWQLVSEIQVMLPKAAPRTSPFTSRAPVRLKSEGPITIEYLVSLANRIGDEWPQLARALRIEHARLQSIIQQNHNNMVANLVGDILLAWLKRSPHSKDKALVLAYALRHCGRNDLSDEVREKDRYHKMERSSSARESRIDNAIQTVSRCPSASTRWKPLAQGLGLSDMDMVEIEHGYRDENQRCEQMLHLWKQKETEYRLKTLVRSLRHIGCKYVADHLESAKR